MCLWPPLPNQLRQAHALGQIEPIISSFEVKSPWQAPVGWIVLCSASHTRRSRSPRMARRAVPTKKDTAEMEWLKLTGVPLWWLADSALDPGYPDTGIAPSSPGLSPASHDVTPRTHPATTTTDGGFDVKQITWMMITFWWIYLCSLSTIVIKACDCWLDRADFP